MSDNKLEYTAQASDANAFLKESGLSHTNVVGDQQPTFNENGQLGLVVKDDAPEGAEGAVAQMGETEAREEKFDVQALSGTAFIQDVMNHNRTILSGIRHGTKRGRGAYASMQPSFASRASTQRLTQGIGGHSERAQTMAKTANVSSFYALSPVVRRRMVQRYLKDRGQSLSINAAQFARSERFMPKKVELSKGPSAPRFAHRRPYAASLKQTYGLAPHPQPTASAPPRMHYLSHESSKKLWYRSQLPSLSLS